MHLKFRRDRATAILPKYATAGAACFDLHVDGDAPHEIRPGEIVVVSTGLVAEIPQGYAMKVFVRSSMGFKHGIQLANGTGIIDSDFRGVIKLALVNLGMATHRIMPTDRVAQALLVPAPQWTIVEDDDLMETIRGTGGMGSTGR